jgi:type I restriction enzyme S subunit
MELIIPRYLELLLSSQAMQEQLWKTSTSTTVPIINKRKLESLNIDLPPKIEQEVIVSIVEEQLSHLEKSLINVDEIERKSAALKRSLLHSAFTGELTKEWRGAANV